MAKMRAIDAAVRILEKEGVTTAFGVPGAAINPLYSALKKRGSIGHILARSRENVANLRNETLSRSTKRQASCSFSTSK